MLEPGLKAFNSNPSFMYYAFINLRFDPFKQTGKHCFSSEHGLLVLFLIQTLKVFIGVFKIIGLLSKSSSTTYATILLEVYSKLFSFC